MKYSRGFTLIELMIVLALLAIVATVALPGFTNLIESSRITSTTNSLVGLLNFARSEAIRHGRTIAVVPIGGDYANGVAVQVGGGDLRTIEGPPGNLTIAMTAGAALSFRANGLSGQPNDVSYQVCGESGNRGTQITVTQGGQIRSESVVCP